MNCLLKASNPKDQLTIDELAQQTGLTTRSIRSYQSQGLMPPPDVRGRIGYYGEQHLKRLSLIKELKEDGLSLVAIKRLVISRDDNDEEILRFHRTLMNCFEEEQTEVVTLEDLSEWLKKDPDLLDRALKVGLLHPLGADRYEIRSPNLIKAGEELISHGISPSAVFGTLEVTAKACKQIADSHVALFKDQLWQPFESTEKQREQWQHIQAALAQTQPIGAEVLLSVFRLAMASAIEEVIDETNRLAESSERSL